VLDFWHVASYIGKMADALFGKETKESAQWFKKMRRWLRDRPVRVNSFETVFLKKAL
jgi:hypothetical protein